MDTPDNPSAQAVARRYAALVAALIGVIVVVWAIASTVRERIDANERAWFVARLNTLMPDTMRDNDLFVDSIGTHGALGNDAPSAIYRARLLKRPTGAILAITAPDGYGGPIDLLVAVDYSGTLLGVDILRHNETQGIGDTFLPHRSDWLVNFQGRSLDNTATRQWTIKKDGGDFDQFTGASVTPRVIVKTVRRALEYYAAHRDSIFDAPADE